MKIILISIVIPVYNKEKYLNKCIKSVSHQTYKKLEIIIINDGSTDSSKDIIEKWKYKDKRIKYIEQKNKGVATTRNKGISVSEGKYIYFLDADDKIEPHAIEVLSSNIINEKSDIVVGNYYRVVNNVKSSGIDLKKRHLASNSLESTQIKADMFLSNGRPLASACNKLYRVSFIKKFNIQFIDSVFAEDRLFNLICYVRRPNITITNEYIYHYNIVDNSRSKDFSEGFFEESILLLKEFYNYLETSSLMRENEDLLQLNAIYDMNNILKYYQRYAGGFSSLKKAVKLMKSNKLLHSILKQAQMEKVLKNVKVRRLPGIQFKVLCRSYSHMSSGFTAAIYLIIYKMINIKRSLK